MNFKTNAYYDIAVPTSMGVRITPADRLPVHTSRMYQMQATSAESNVLNVSASLGLKVSVNASLVVDFTVIVKVAVCVTPPSV